MSFPSWIDDYAALARPNFGVTFAKIWQDALYKHLGVDNDMDLERRAHEIVEARKKKKAEWLGSFDLGILDAMGLTLDDLIALNRDRQSRSHGGKKRVAISETRLRVFRSFIESERKGASFAQAVSAARQVAPKVTEKSIRNWLNDTIRLGLNVTKPATRDKISRSNGKS